jgi:hypothetical protein
VRCFAGTAKRRESRVAISMLTCGKGRWIRLQDQHFEIAGWLFFRKHRVGFVYHDRKRRDESKVQLPPAFWPSAPVGRLLNRKHRTLGGVRAEHSSRVLHARIGVEEDSASRTLRDSEDERRLTRESSFDTRIAIFRGFLSHP